MLEVARLALEHRPCTVIVDWALGTAVEAGLSHVASAYAVHQFDVLTPWCGDRVAKGRRVALLSNTPEEAQTFLRALCRHEVAAPEELGAVLLPLDAIPPDKWVALSGLVWDSRLRRREELFLPAAGGTWRPQGNQDKQLVYTCKGPMLTPTLRNVPGKGARRRRLP